MYIKMYFIILLVCFFNSIQAISGKIHKTPKSTTQSKKEEPSSKKKEPSIAVGIPAPAFSLPDQDGKIHSLDDYKGWKIALCFYPKNHTRKCIAQMCSLRNGWEKLKARGIIVLGINFDSQAMHAQFAKDQQLNFPLLSDLDKKIGVAYNVKKWYSPNPERITYIIDEGGKIFSIIDKVNSQEHAKQILEHIDTKTHPTQTPVSSSQDSKPSNEAKPKEPVSTK